MSNTTMLIVAIVGGLGLLLSSDKSVSWLKSWFRGGDVTPPNDATKTDGRSPIEVADQLLSMAAWMRDAGDAASATALVNLAQLALQHDGRATSKEAEQ